MGKDDFSARLGAANDRLRAAKVKVAIGQTGDRLWLRATLPPKTGSTQIESHQQRIYLALPANPSGLAQAEKEARKVAALLVCKEFSWEPYIKQAVEPTHTVGNWVVRFEQDYWVRRQRTPQAESTWKADYQKVFSKLPVTEPLTHDLLRQAIAATTPDTRTRQRWCKICARLAKFAGLEADFKDLMGSYSAFKPTPRTIPTDETIAEWWAKVPNPHWQVVYGLLACYGLRPHEVFSCDRSALPLLRVGRETKTGERIVYPLYPEWVTQWQLTGELPIVSGKTNSDLGQRVTRAFGRYGIPFKPYDLRHAWAIRSIAFGLDISLASAQMGHSVQIHTQIYHAWISEDVHQRAFDLIMTRRDRPKPPS